MCIGFKSALSIQYIFSSWSNKPNVCMSRFSSLGDFAWELLYVLNRKRAHMCSHNGCRREKCRVGPCVHWALLPEQLPGNFWWLRYMLFCHLLRKLTKQWEGGRQRRTQTCMCSGNGRSYCSGELISSKGPLLILEGSMEPHCACGFCSRWFFSIDFSPSGLKDFE